MTEFISDRKDAILWSIELWSDTKQAYWVQGNIHKEWAELHI